MPNSICIDLSTINPKQAQFFESRARYTAYGGARGGGKSWAVQRKSILLALRYGGIKILLLRRTYKDLERNHVRAMIPLLTGIAKYGKQDKCFTFPNGSIIELGYCAAESDVLQYQGQEYDIIFIDEATQFTEYQYDVLTACVRGANDMPHRMYLTCNPGGVGHEWVKRLFVTRHYKQSEVASDYVFIHANVYDNKQLMEQDSDYVRMLENLPPGLREMWLDGNWDVLAGRYFSEFDRSVHVIEPFNIPDHWRRYAGIDYGLDCLACVWAAVDEFGNVYIYREYAEPDKAISIGAKEVLELQAQEHIEYVAAPSDLWARSQESGRTKADLFADAGLDLLKVTRDREAGWLAIKDMMQIYDIEAGVKESRLKIFNNCVNLIEHLPALQRSQLHPTDCATEPHEITHLPDALRYFLTQYINASPIPRKKQSHLQKWRSERLKGKNGTKKSYY